MMTNISHLEPFAEPLQQPQYLCKALLETRTFRKRYREAQTERCNGIPKQRKYSWLVSRKKSLLTAHIIPRCKALITNGCSNNTYVLLWPVLGHPSDVLSMSDQHKFCYRLFSH